MIDDIDSLPTSPTTTSRAVLWLSALAALAAGCDSAPPAAPSGLDADPWVVRTDAELDSAIAAARAEARASERLVLLDFVADWCSDCREVIRVSKLEPARGAIEERYVVVYVEVGRFDRHRALLREHEIDRIAALVVLDPETGRRVAKTTLEPITTRAGLTPEELASWLRSVRGR